MITFKEVKEKDLSTLARIYSVVYLNIKMGETWTFETALSYMQYFYHYQPDLFICAYDDDIPVGAIMSTLKPYYDGLHLTETELFVLEDYRGQNIGKKLLEMHFELAIAKYDASRIDAITYINNPDSPLDWYKKIGLEPINNLVVLQGNLEDCLTKLKKKYKKFFFLAS